jgi:hypothetical protein
MSIGVVGSRKGSHSSVGNPVTRESRIGSFGSRAKRMKNTIQFDDIRYIASQRFWQLLDGWYPLARAFFIE